MRFLPVFAATALSFLAAAAHADDAPIPAAGSDAVGTAHTTAGVLEATQTREAPKSGTSTQEPAQTIFVHDTATHTALTVGLDVGRARFANGSSPMLTPSIGLFRMYEQSDGSIVRRPGGGAGGGLGGTVWFGYGGEFRLLVPTDTGVSERPLGVGGQLAAKGRVSMLGDAGGTSFDASVGVAQLPGGATRATGAVGINISMLYVDLGYGYQIPLDGGSRPFGLTSHQFTFRVTIPVRTTNRTHRETPQVSPQQTRS